MPPLVIDILDVPGPHTELPAAKSRRVLERDSLLPAATTETRRSIYTRRESLRRSLPILSSALPIPFPPNCLRASRFSSRGWLRSAKLLTFGTVVAATSSVEKHEYREYLVRWPREIGQFYHLGEFR